MAAEAFITTITGLSGSGESGGLLYSFVKGTSTPRPLYTDDSLGTPASNPVEADSIGQITAYFDTSLSYTWRAKTADGATTLWEANVVGGILSITYINPEYSEHPIIEATWIEALGTPLGEQWPAAFANDYSGAVDVAWYGAACDGTTDDTAAWVAALADASAKAIYCVGISVITTVPIARSVEIFSYGYSGIVKQKAATAADMFPITGDGVNVVFHDMIINQDCDNQTARSPYAMIRHYATGGATLNCQRLKLFNPCEQAIDFRGDKLNTTNEQCTIRDIVGFGGSQGNQSPLYAPTCFLITDAPIYTIENVVWDLGVAPTLGRGLIWCLATVTDANFATVTINNVTGYRMGCTTSPTPGCIDMYQFTSGLKMTNCRLYDTNGAGYRIKTQSKQVTMDNLSYEGGTSGTYPFSVATPADGDAGLQYQITNIQLKVTSALGNAAMIITGEDASHVYTAGIRVQGVDISGHDAEGIVVEVCENFQILDAEVRGGTIPYSIQSCEGLNALKNIRALDATGAYGIYVDSSPNGDFQIVAPQVRDSGTTSAIYASGRKVAISDVDIHHTEAGIRTGALAQLVINGGQITGLDSGEPAVEISGTVSGNVSVFGVTSDSTIPISRNAAIGGSFNDFGNSWNQGDNRGYFSGLELANNSTDATNDIDFAAGRCMDSTESVMLRASAMTKQLDAAWAAGDNQGGRDTGSIADGWWHCYVILKDSDGSGDFIFSTSATSPTMPSGYTYYRHIGAILRTSSAIRAFKQTRNRVVWDSKTGLDINVTDPGSSAVTHILPGAPTGIRTKVILNLDLIDLTPAAGTNCLITQMDQTDSAPSVTNSTINIRASGASVPFTQSETIELLTDTSAQIRSRTEGSTADLVLLAGVAGYEYMRAQS